MHNVLNLIIEAKKKKVRVLKKTEKEIISLIKQAPKPRSLAKVLRDEKDLSIIAELKQFSPSSGLLRQDFNHLQILKDYQEVGVSAISIVTEEEFFLGKLKFLKEIREKANVPVLRKDFLVDDVQIYQSRALGADAILLISRILKIEKLVRLYKLSKELGMDVIVEVHNLKELKEVLKLSPDIIGINNRNLDTFVVDLNVTLQLSPVISHDNLIISESGISTLKDILLLKGAGVDGILIGEAFMRASDIKEKVKEFKIGCKD